MVDIKLIQGDCLERMKETPDGSVDLILTDLPYGTMNGFAGIDWDFAIDPIKVFEIANRILRKNGKMVLFSQEPYTSRLITQAIANVPFSYRMVWEKDNFANALLANKAPVGMFEDILVFSKRFDTELKNPIRKILKEILEDKNIEWNDNIIITRLLESGIASNEPSAITIASHKFKYDYAQIEPMTKKQWDLFFDIFDYPISYEEFRKLNKDYNTSTFNLWQGKKYKSNILKYKKDYDGYHPTQKPLLLLEDLIKTFSNEGNLVVDLTMGSGSTGVACVNTKRDFIGIEKDEGYFKIAQDRINQAVVNINKCFTIGTS